MMKTFRAAIAAMAVMCAAIACPASCAEHPRVVSLSPTATEILFDLGLGDRLVGATEYCTQPPEARDVPRVGDAMHANIELIASISPDLAVISEMNAHLAGDLEKIGVRTEMVRGETFEDICESMTLLGRACGVETAAAARVEALREAVREAALGMQSDGARVLVVVGRDERFTKVYAAGARSFYSDVLASCGAENALKADVPYAALSLEGVIAADPDVIIEVVGDDASAGRTEDDVAREWSAAWGVRAGEEGRAYCIIGDFAVRAGPRYPMIIRAFAERLAAR